MEIIHLREKLIMTGDNVMKVKPNDVMIRYTGRIDWTDEEKPVWVYPCTSAEMKFTGRTLRIKVSNKNNYWDNYLGCIIDQSQRSYLLNKEGITELDIVVPDSDTDEHRVLFFKRQDESVCSCVLLPLSPQMHMRVQEGSRYARLAQNFQVSERIQMRRWDILIISRMDGQVYMPVTA